MIEHISAERMHDLVDGLLPPTEQARVEEHLEACARCRAEVETLASVVRGLAELPRMATPPGELWEGIETRIRATPLEEPTTEGATVVPLPTARAVGARRFAFSISQLAAAAAVVAMLSAGTVWIALSGGGGDGPAAALDPDASGAARMVSSGEASYRSAALELETVLEAGRDVLAPETLAALEASLRTIDQAIAEVESALRADPSSDILARMLVNHQGARLRVLRKAATLVQANL